MSPAAPGSRRRGGRWQATRPQTPRGRSAQAAGALTRAVRPRPGQAGTGGIRPGPRPRPGPGPGRARGRRVPRGRCARGSPRRTPARHPGRRGRRPRRYDSLRVEEVHDADDDPRQRGPGAGEDRPGGRVPRGRRLGDVPAREPAVRRRQHAEAQRRRAAGPGGRLARRRDRGAARDRLEVAARPASARGAAGHRRQVADLAGEPVGAGDKPAVRQDRPPTPVETVTKTASRAPRSAP